MDIFDQASIVPHRDGTCGLTWVDREKNVATVRTRQFETRREAEAFARSLGLEPIGPEMALALLLPTKEKAFSAAKSGDWHLAEELAHAVLRVDPDDGDMRRILGVIYLKTDRLDESITEFEMATRINPSDGAAHHNLGVAYAYQGRRDDAIAALKKAAATGMKSAIGSDLLQLLHRVGKGSADDPSTIELTKTLTRQYFQSRKRGS